jgi:hypothetical protein
MRPLAPLFAASVAAALAAPAWAGPPYATDDPQPTERGHWEIYNFATGAHVEGATSGEAGLDLNYGGAKDLQLTLVIPAAFAHSDGETHVGMGVVEAAAKLKFVHQDKDGWRPDVAVFPRLFLPTAPARFASRQVGLLLPVWAEKDFGPWAVFGGGGFQLNPGAGNRDFWTGGLAVTRQVTERLNLGAEITHRSREAEEGRDFTAANLGVIYRLTDHWSLLASGGPGLQNARDDGRYDFYVSLKADY